MAYLLLVVYRGDVDFLTLRIAQSRRHRAALAIGRHNDATSRRHVAALLFRKRQRAVVDLFVGPRVGRRTASERVVFGVEFARPFVVYWLTSAVNAFHGHLDVVARSLINNRGVLRHAWTEL